MTTVANTTPVKSPEAPSLPRSTKPLVFLVLGILTSAGLGIGLGVYIGSFTSGIISGCVSGTLVLGVFFTYQKRKLPSTTAISNNVVSTNSTTSTTVVSKPLATQDFSVSETPIKILSALRPTVAYPSLKGFCFEKSPFIVIRYGDVGIDLIPIQNLSNLTIKDILLSHLERRRRSEPELEGQDQETMTRDTLNEGLQKLKVRCNEWIIPHYFPIAKLPNGWLNITYDQAPLQKKKASSYSEEEEIAYSIQELNDTRCISAPITLKFICENSEWEFTAAGNITIEEALRVWFYMHKHLFRHRQGNVITFESVKLNGSDHLFDRKLNTLVNTLPNGRYVQREPLNITLSSCTKIT